MAHGEAREGKWRGNWRIEWVASTLTLPRNVVYPALLTLMRTLRLPAVDWTDAPAYLNGLVRFGERRNLVSARVPWSFKWTLLHLNLRCSIPKCLWNKRGEGPSNTTLLLLLLQLLLQLLLLFVTVIRIPCLLNSGQYSVWEGWLLHLIMLKPIQRTILFSLTYCFLGWQMT